MTYVIEQFGDTTAQREGSGTRNGLMLRITITQQGDSAIIRLEGKLIGAWVEELRRCWRETLAQTKGRKIVADLDAVSFMDVPGQKLLREMHLAGTTLVGRGVLTTHLLDQIEGHYAS